MMRAANDILCYSGIVTSPMKVFAVSDLHVDYRENLDWIDSLSRDRYREDVLLLAGDVTDDLRLLGSTLRALKSRFAE
ncbi:MAG: metallophosphoesterase, partial [Pseudohongiellaceae bacterium]